MFSPVLLSAVAGCLLAGTEAHIRGISSKTKFQELKLLNQTDVDETLALEMSAVENNMTRFTILMDSLRPTYQALPKSEHGHLSEQTVRYVLHRYFLDRRGWLIRGLEPKGNPWETQLSKVHDDLLAWVPSYLQKRIQEQKSHRHGIELLDLAEIVATIEDLVRREADHQLEDIYEALGWEPSAVLDRKDAKQVIDYYMLVMLMSRNVSVANPTKSRKWMAAFEHKYKGFKEMHEWLEGVESKTMEQDAATFDFNAVSKVVQEVGEQYPIFNDQECQDLKVTMMGMEGGSRKPGRIPLADFYNKSRFGHWKFTESPAYLRDLGALDESDPQRPHVILANYVSSFNNCLRSTSLYAVCCRSPCEQLMASLEQSVAAPSATVAQLVPLVAKLSTDTVPARGAQGLEAKLLQRLEGVASSSGSEVPLHGRLFAQWMHHAFPRECPYPHEAGVINPQTPDEWMKTAGRAIVASDAQIEQIVNDFCPASGSLSTAGDATQASPCDSAEAEDLPWTDTEELLARNVVAPGPPQVSENAEEPEPPYHLFVLLSLPAVALGSYAIDQKLVAKGPEVQRKGRVLMACALMAYVGVTFDLLDLRITVGAGLFYFLWKPVWKRFAGPQLVLPLAQKIPKCEV